MAGLLILNRLINITNNLISGGPVPCMRTIFEELKSIGTEEPVNYTEEFNSMLTHVYISHAGVLSIFYLYL
jgi:hypothetical protein